MFYDLSTALSILASSSANAWCSCQLSTSFYITRRYNMSDKYCFLCHLVPPKFEHLSENCIRTSKCLNNEPIFAIIAKRKTEGGGTWQFPCSKAMPFFRAAGQRFPPGLIRATRPCSVRSGRHYDIILLWIYTVGKILAIILVCSSIHTSSSPAKCDSSIHRGEVGKDTVLDLRPRSRCPGQPVAGCPWLCQSTFYFWVWNRDI